MSDSTKFQKHDGRYWHQTDMPGRLTMSAPEGKTGRAARTRALPFLAPNGYAGAG
jgi:hypothetical protein